MSNEEEKYKFCPTCKNKLEWEKIDNEKHLACSQCGFIFWNNPKPVVSIVLHKGGKVLMLQRAKEPFKNYWVLPGGFISYEETTEEAIKRETREETELDLSIGGMVGVYRIDNDPRGVHIDIIYYGESSGKIKLSEEDNDYEYFDFRDLPEHIAYKHREAIRDWAKNNMDKSEEF